MHKWHKFSFHSARCQGIWDEGARQLASGEGLIIYRWCQLIAMYVRRSEIALSVLSHKGTNPIHEGSDHLNYLPRFLSLTIITLVLSISTHAFWRSTNIQDTTTVTVGCMNTNYSWKIIETFHIWNTRVKYHYETVLGM